MKKTRRKSPRRRNVAFRLLGSCILCCAAFYAAVTTASAVTTSAIVVEATIPSATRLDPTGCASGTPGSTALGTVLPGADLVSSTDCTVIFGSSNDTATLRLYQSDGSGAAMTSQRSWQSTGTSLGDLWRVRGSGSTLYAVGTDGVLVKSTDTGATWTTLNLGNTTRTMAIAVIDPNTILVGNDNGDIVRSTDGGADFTTVLSTGKWLEGIDCYGLNDCWAVGHNTASDDKIYASTDGGATWFAESSGYPNDIVAQVAAFGAGTAVAVVDNVGAIRTTDGGATWTLVSGEPSGTLEDVDAVTSTIGFAAGGRYLYRTTDGGATWQTVYTDPAGTTSFYGISSADGTTVTAVDEAGEIVESDDGGTTWNVAANIGDWATSVYMNTAHTGVVVGQDDVALRLADAGNNFAQFASGSNDWASSANSLFGVCLKTLTDATTDTGWATDGSCTDSTASPDPWNPVVATRDTAGADVADTVSGTDDAEAHFRFGLRAAPNQPAGSYVAPVTFEVIAPSV